jgi:hypothetical protein
MDYLIGFLLFAGYVSLGYFITRLIHKRTVGLKLAPKALIRSFSYSMLFGIGILTRGGNPGFAIPMPILPAGFFGIWDWIPVKYFINGIIIPFLFWWGTNFLVVFGMVKLRNKRVA